MAAGIVPIAHANDGGGSIRIPSSANGLFGLKPSHGRVPNAPAVDSFSYPVGCNHAVTRTVRDSAALLDAVRRADVGDTFAAPPPTRPFLDEVGAAREICASGSPPDRRVSLPTATRDAVRRAAALCEELGHEVEEAPFTYDAELQRCDGRDHGGERGVRGRPRGSVSWAGTLRNDDLEPFTRVLYEVGARWRGRR